MYKPVNINVMIDCSPNQNTLEQLQYQTYNTHITPLTNPSSMNEKHTLEIPYGFYNHINQYIMFDYSNSNAILDGSIDNELSNITEYTIAPALIKHMYDITTLVEMKEKTQALLEKIKIYIANNIIVFSSFANTETLKTLISKYNTTHKIIYFDLLISGDKSIMCWISKNNSLNSFSCIECEAPIDIGDYYIQTKCCNQNMHCVCLLDKLSYYGIDNCSNEYEKQKIEITCTHCKVTCEDYWFKNTEVLMYFSN
jgi:hypothetical protein